MECKITIEDEWAVKHGIKTQKEFEAFCKDAVASKLFTNQFMPHNPSLKADKLPSCQNCKEPQHDNTSCCPQCGTMYPLAP